MIRAFPRLLRVNQQRPRRYRNLALGLLGVILLPPFLRTSFPGASLLGPAIFVVLVTRAIVLTRGSRLLRTVLISAMGAVALRGARVAHLITIEPWGLAMALHVLTVLGLSFVVFEVLLDVLGNAPVNADKLYGAVAAYLLLGLTFASGYEALAFWKPQAFSIAVGESAQVDMLMYFSLVTLSTVGYGDVVPVIPEAQVLAVCEAILGQLYLAILMARLVGLHLTQAGTAPGRGPAPGSEPDYVSEEP
jgi:hypothetical protein